MSSSKEERAAASEMVERVARALFNKEWEPAADRHLGKTAHDWQAEWPSSREYWLASASAAIAAMREPTSEMIAAGVRAAASLRPEGAPLAWRAMIDAATASNGSPSASEASGDG